MQHAEQRRLRRRRKLADLVEEQRASVRILEAAGISSAPAAGEGAGLVTEELRLDELRGDGSAMDHHQGAPAPQAGRVDGMGEELLARAGFAAQHHRQRVARGGASNLDRHAQRRGTPLDTLEVIARGMGGGMAAHRGLAAAGWDTRDTTHHQIFVEHGSHRRVPRRRQGEQLPGGDAQG